MLEVGKLYKTKILDCDSREFRNFKHNNKIIMVVKAEKTYNYTNNFGKCPMWISEHYEVVSGGQIFSVDIEPNAKISAVTGIFSVGKDFPKDDAATFWYERDECELFTIEQSFSSIFIEIK